MRPPEDAYAASTMTGASLPVAGDDTVRRYVRTQVTRHRRTFVLGI